MFELNGHTPILYYYRYTYLQDTQLVNAYIRDGIKIIGVIGNCHWFC